MIITNKPLIHLLKSIDIFFEIYGVRVNNNHTCVHGKKNWFGFVIYDFGQIINV